MDVDTLREKYAVAGLCIRQKEKADIYDFVEDILRNKGYSIDRELLKRAIAKPHRTVSSPVSYEKERRTARALPCSLCFPFYVPFVPLVPSPVPCSLPPVYYYMVGYYYTVTRISFFVLVSPLATGGCGR